MRIASMSPHGSQSPCAIPPGAPPRDSPSTPRRQLRRLVAWGALDKGGQEPSQHHPGAMHSLTDCRWLDLQDLRHISRRELLQIPQHEGNTIMLGQTGDRLLHMRDQPLPVDQILDPRRNHEFFWRLPVSSRAVELRKVCLKRLLGTAAPGTYVHQRGVSADPVQPRSKSRFAAKRRQVPEHLQERLLHDVEGVLVVSGESVCQSINTVLIARDELLEGRVFPSRGACSQGFVRDSRIRSHSQGRPHNTGSSSFRCRAASGVTGAGERRNSHTPDLRASDM